MELCVCVRVRVCTRARPGRGLGVGLGGAWEALEGLGALWRVTLTLVWARGGVLWVIGSGRGGIRLPVGGGVASPRSGAWSGLRGRGFSAIGGETPAGGGAEGAC